MPEANHLQRISEDQLLELAKTYGRVKHVVYNGVDLVFRKPKRAECQQYMMKREEGGASKIAADEQLAQFIIVRCGNAEGSDARKAFNDLLEDWPLLANEASVAQALGKLAGVVQDESVKSGGST